MSSEDGLRSQERQGKQRYERNERNQKLIAIHKKRLYILEEQAASFGLSCPPHILMEIESIKEKIAELQ